MSISKSVSEMREFVSSMAAADTQDMQGVQHALDQLEKEKETLGAILAERLDELMHETMQAREEEEQESERSEEVERGRGEVKEQLRQAKVARVLSEEERERCKARLEEAGRLLEACQTDGAKVEELGADNAKLVQARKILYTISRLTLDRNAKKEEVKGFVVNPRKEDVNIFNFNKDDAGVSPYFITNHIWSLIAAGTDPSWAKIGL